MFRILALIGVILTGVFFPLCAFVGVGLAYAWIYTPYEVLFIALCIDAQFGDPGRGMWYLYTLATTGVLLVTLYSKPFFRFNRDYTT